MGEVCFLPSNLPNHIVCAVNGYIQRSEPHVYYSPKIGLTHVGKVTKFPEKGKPIIVVLEVKRVAHAFWQLVYEAECICYAMLRHRTRVRRIQVRGGDQSLLKNNLYSFSGGPLDYKARLRGANSTRNLLCREQGDRMETRRSPDGFPLKSARLPWSTHAIFARTDDRLHRLVPP